jgi:hypothetical protein
MSKVDEELVRCHILIGKEDHATIMALFGETLGFSKAVRGIIKSWLKQSRERSLRDVAKPVNVSVEEILEEANDE